MKVQVFKTWNRIRSSFWFLPTVMVGGAMILAFATVDVDKPMTDWFAQNWNFTFTGGAEGASSLLATWINDYHRWGSLLNDFGRSVTGFVTA